MRIEHLIDNPQYIEFVADWIYKEFVQNIRNDIDLSFIINAFKNRRIDSVPLTLVAIDEDKCIGTVTLFANDLKTRMDLTPWLGALFVDENHRSKGVAKKLINQLLIITRELKYNCIYLRTEHTSEYYKKDGWEFLFKEKDELGIDTEVFVKRF